MNQDHDKVAEREDGGDDVPGGDLDWSWCKRIEEKRNPAKHGERVAEGKEYFWGHTDLQGYLDGGKIESSGKLYAVKINFDTVRMSRYMRIMKDDYHHGDLRRALLEAAEAELNENGLEGFSLRKVAKRAGVSHAAPAHHFKDVSGLLTALAAEGYRRFVTVQEKRQSKEDSDPAAQLIAQGLGYVDFATANTALFRLMFSSDRPSFADVALADASGAAFTKLADGIGAVTGVHPYQDEGALQQACAMWSMAHGISDLISSGRMSPIANMPKNAREKIIRSMLARAMPQDRP